MKQVKTGWTKPGKDGWQTWVGNELVFAVSVTLPDSCTRANMDALYDKMITRLHACVPPGGQVECLREQQRKRMVAAEK